MNNVQVRYWIKSSQEILYLKRFGESFSDSNLVLIKKRNELGYSRYAVIASKAVGGAVQRNRCKRRIRNRINRFIKLCRPDVDLLFIARLPLLESSSDELDQSIYTLINSAGLLIS